MDQRIFHMHQTVELRDRLREDAWNSINLPKRSRPVFYWHIERKKKRGCGWVFVRDFHGTAKQAGELFLKFFNDGGHRLRAMVRF